MTANGNELVKLNQLKTCIDALSPVRYLQGGGHYLAGPDSEPIAQLIATVNKDRIGDQYAMLKADDDVCGFRIDNFGRDIQLSSSIENENALLSMNVGDQRAQIVVDSYESKIVLGREDTFLSISFDNSLSETEASISYKCNDKEGVVFMPATESSFISFLK